MSRIWKWIGLAALGGLVVWGVASRRENEQGQEAVKTPSHVTAEGVIRLDAETQARIGLRLETLTAASLQPELVAYGHLEEDPSHSFVLRAPVAGTVRGAAGREWPSVGQILADQTAVGAIEPRIPPVDRVNLSDRLTTARADVEAATASLAAARAAYTRARTLNADNKIVSDRAVEEAEARAKAEEARLTAATQSARLIEASLQAASARATKLEVDRGGQVVEVLAQPGEAVESGQPILRVARFDRLLARVDVPAGDRVDTRVAAARVVAIGQEEHPVRAQRVGLAAAVDPRTQGQSWLFRVAGTSLGLRPGQAVTAYLELPGARRAGVVAPRAAVVRYAGKTWLYVATGPRQFARREVALEEAAAGGWFTRSLAAGTRVVAEGAQTLLSEELKSHIQVGEENPA